MNRCLKSEKVDSEFCVTLLHISVLAVNDADEESDNNIRTQSTILYYMRCTRLVLHWNDEMGVGTDRRWVLTFSEHEYQVAADLREYVNVHPGYQLKI